MRLKTVFYVILAFIAFPMFAQDVYIATDGNDENTGTKEAPFATLERAVEEVAGNALGKTIWLKGGTYTVNSAVNLTSSHAGLTISAMPGEEVIITGGTPIPGHLFKTVTDAAELQLVPSNARGKVMVAKLNTELSAMFPSKTTYNKTASISWNGYILNRAQYPNKGFAYIDDILDAGPTTRWLEVGEEPEPYSEENPTGGRFTVRENIDWGMMAAEFNRTKDMLVEGYLNNDWYFQNERVGAISTSEESIKLLRYTSYGIGGNVHLDRRFRITNALCQLDQPGEWYFDRLENKLYYWPVQPPNSQNPLTILSGGRLIYGSDVDNLKILRITFQNFGDEGVHVSNSDNVLIAGCTFRSSNGLGLRIGAGKNCGIQSNDFYNMRQAFVLGGSTDNRKTLTPENNYAVNNHIHHCTLKGYGLLAITGMGNLFANNLLHDMNGSLSYAGNDLIIEKNEFYNMGYEMGDWNACYANMDLSTRGNYFRYNFFHHMICTPTSHQLAPIRSDDLGSGCHIESNIMYKSGTAGCMGYGPENSYAKNFTIETQHLWWTNQFPYEETPKDEWADKTTVLQEKYDWHVQLQEDIKNGLVDFNVKENKIGKAELIFGEKGWENNELWKSHYPHFEHTFDYFSADDNPWSWTHGDYTKNYASGTASLPFHFHGYNSIQTFADIELMMPSSSPIEMPIFVDLDTVFQDADHMDFNFRADFVGVDGFEKWNFSEVGLYIDEYRTSMPDKSEYRNAIKDKYADTPAGGGSLDLDKLNDRYSYPEYLSLVSEVSLLPAVPEVLFPMNESFGGRAYDVIDGQKAVWQNADTSLLSWEPAQVANGAMLNGAYFKLDKDSLDGAVELSISAWIYASDITTKSTVVETGNVPNNWSVYTEASKVKAAFNGVELTGSANLKVNEWTFVVATWAQDGSIKLYQDGQLVAENTNGPASYASVGSWNFGASFDASNVFGGGIDELAMYKYVLNADEVSFLYQSGVNGLYTSSFIPVYMSGLSVSPEALVLRERFEGLVNIETSPANAANQAVVWSSDEPAVVSVDEDGYIKALAPGNANIIAVSEDGGIKDTCKVNVVNTGEKTMRDPVGYWPLNEAGGKIAHDLAQGNDAQWQDAEAPTWSAGLFQNAADYTGGDNDRFVVSADPLKGATAWSISAWFKLNKTGQYEGLVTTRNAEKQNNWGFSAAGNKADARFNGASTYTHNFIATGNWYNLIQTWDTSGTERFYIDGELFMERKEDRKVYTSNDVWYFGDDVCCGGREINGQLDDITMFDTVLTNDEVVQINTMGRFGSSIRDMIATYVQSVELNKENLNLVLDSTYQLEATVAPEEATDKTIIWSSSDEEVATVDSEGLITGVSVGNADIVVRSSDGDLTDTLKLSVYSIPPTSIDINHEAIDLYEGESFMLSATVLPDSASDKTFTWTSENESVAEVGKFGLVKGIKEGTTNIVATTTDGNLIDMCEVNVKYIHVDSIKLSVEKLTLEIGQKDTLEASFYPENAQDKSMVWLSDNSTIAAIDQAGIVEGIAKGVTIVSAFGFDGPMKAECEVVVGNVSVDLSKVYEDLMVYPNPAVSKVNISSEGFTVLDSNLEIYNTLGSLVYSEDVTSGDHVHSVDVSTWESGVYFVKVRLDHRTYVKHFVKE